MRTNWMNRVSVVVATLAIACAVAGPARADKPGRDIVDTAVAAGSFKTLAAALQAADLVDALKGEGPFTVFAPTDDAFAKLPKETVATLLKPENRAQLAAILTYHVVAGEVPAAKVVTLTAAETLNGQRVDVKAGDSGVTIDGANVVKADISCSNGIIHVIDSVILPSSDNIPATAVKAGKFNTLVAAVKAAGLVDALSGDGPLTVFAPTDDAFAKLPEGTVESLLKEENRDKLTAILTYHVVPGRIFSDAALEAGKAKTLQGQTLRIAASADGAKVNDANLIATDIDAANGVIHVIDSVLLPPADGQAAANPRHMIEAAVGEGVTLYNSGHISQCAGVYKTTVRKMLALEDHGMSPHAVRALQTALHQADNSHCSATQAWALRRAMDMAYRSMRPLDAVSAAE